MKKLLLITFVLLSTVIIGQDVSYTYSFKEPRIETKGDYVSIVFDNTLQTGIYGEPMLPYYATELLLNPGYEAYDYSIEYMDKQTISLRAQLYPKQAVKPVSQATENNNFYKDENVYRSGNIYPAKKEGVLTTQYYRGHAIANISFTPVEYNPSDNTISYYSSVKVNIKTRQTDKSLESLKMIKQTEDINKIVDNKRQLDLYKSYYKDRSAMDYDILILSSNEYEEAFNEINEIYLKFGLVSKFKDLNEIYSEYDGVDNPEKIRNYIINEYQNYSIEYVVLGGDVEIMPYRSLYGTVQSSSFHESNDIPSDIYFSALDGSWNDNNNDKWGEIGEEDLYPEVSVGRMPYSNMSEFNAMKNKIIKHQTSPVLGELNKPLLAGELLAWAPISYGADYLRLLVGYRTDNGYTTQGIPPTDPYDSLYQKDVTWGFFHLIPKLNGGPTFIYHAGHGNYDQVMTMYNSDMTNDNFEQVDGIQHNFPLVYSHACISGAFDSTDCIAEHMLKLETFAIAGCFNSRYGWFNEGQSDGPSAHLNREFVNALYGDEISEFGRAHKQSKTATAPWVNASGEWEEGATRWCFYCCNSLGYPALKVWRDDPYDLNAEYNNVIIPGTDQYQVTVKDHNNQPLAYANCILLDQNNNVIGKGKADDNGICNIQITGNIPVSGEDIKLFVSGYNTMPKEYSIEVNTSNIAIINFIDNYFTDENGNGLAEYDEQIEYTLSIKNTGTAPGTNLNVNVTSANENLIILSDNITIPVLNINDSYDIKIQMKLSETVTDQTQLPFTVSISGEKRWSFSDVIIANAPKLVITEIMFSDENDNSINQGETLDIIINMKNEGHAPSGEISINVDFDSDQISFPQGNSSQINNLEINADEAVSIKITASDNIEVGSELFYNVNYVNRTIEYTETYSTIVKQGNNIININNNISIYPNPVKDILNIDLDSYPANIEVINSIGQMIMKISLDENTIIDFSSLEKGIYILNIYDDINNNSFKIIKE